MQVATCPPRSPANRPLSSRATTPTLPTYRPLSSRATTPTLPTYQSSSSRAATPTLAQSPIGGARDLSMSRDSCADTQRLPRQDEALRSARPLPAEVPPWRCTAPSDSVPEDVAATPSSPAMACSPRRRARTPPAEDLGDCFAESMGRSPRSPACRQCHAAESSQMGSSDAHIVTVLTTNEAQGNSSSSFVATRDYDAHNIGNGQLGHHIPSRPERTLSQPAPVGGNAFCGSAKPSPCGGSVGAICSEGAEASSQEFGNSPSFGFASPVSRERRNSGSSAHSPRSARDRNGCEYVKEGRPSTRRSDRSTSADARGCQSVSSDVHSKTSKSPRSRNGNTSGSLAAAAIVASGQGTGHSDLDSTRNATSPSQRTLTLRTTLEAELAEKRRIEVNHASTAARLIESEAQAERLAAELRDIRKERDSLRRQLKDKSERISEVSKKLRHEQETHRCLEADIAKVDSSVKDLETRARAEQLARANADSSVLELQQKLFQLEQEGLLGVHSGLSRDDSAAAVPAGLEIQLDQLRRQLEETIRVVQNRPKQHSAESAPSKKTPRGQCNSSGPRLDAVSPDIAAIGASAFSLANISSLETASPCSSMDVVGIAAASSVDAEELQPEIDVGVMPKASLVLTPQRSSVAGAGLSLRDLSEIRALKKPPPPVRMLMEICCMLFQISPISQLDDRNRRCYEYWEPARRYLLSDPFFPQKLRTYDASRISQAQRAKVKRYLRDPEFTVERVTNCSRAALELYNWVRAVIEQDPVSPSPMPSPA